MIAAYKFDPSKGAAFPTFATLLIRNMLRDELRKARADKRTARSSQSATYEVDYAGELDTALQMEAVEAAIKQLPARHSHAMVLRYLFGYRYREIAKELGVAHGTVGIYIREGRALLRQILK